MQKRKSSKQLKNMIIALIILILVVLILFVIFIFNIDVANIGSVNVEELFSTEATNEVEEQTTVDGVIFPEEMSSATYQSIAFDLDNTFQVRVAENKVYFKVIDKEKFEEKYFVSAKSEEKEIATHDYKVKEVYIGSCLEEEFLLVIMENGSMGIMNISEALNENVFRIKNELITLEEPIRGVYGVVRNMDEEASYTTILVTSSGKKYDLQKFVEEKF